MKQPETIQNYWSLDQEQLFELLHTSENGLGDTEVKQSKEAWGENVLVDRSKNGPVKVFAEQFLSPLIWILIFAGLVTGYLGEIMETIVVFSAVVINIAFAFYQEYKAENTIEQLRSYVKNRTTVLRNGELRDVDAKELVPGDVVSITYGNRVPADGRLIKATSLYVDEAILTGESLPVEKKEGVVVTNEIAERENSVFCGTYVTQGVALMVVTATGNHTEIGMIAKTVTETRHAKTPVQKAVRQISWYIFLIALVIVTLIFFLGIARGENLLDMLVLSSAVAVGAVPEALPITLTVILSVGVLAISKKGGLIRKLSAAETLGSTTLILTDKTGTLTKAELSLDGIYTADMLLAHRFHAEQRVAALTHDQKNLIKLTAANIQATVEKVGDNVSQWIYSGGAFDVVMLKSMYRFGIADAVRHNERLLVPFNSSNKYSISRHDQETIILGAPDILINRSAWGDVEKSLAQDRVALLGAEGKRLIALGRKPFDQHPESIEGMEIVALFAFSDPLREEVVTAVQEMLTKGIGVKIITGDMMGTARAIARQVGIPTEDHEVLTGDQISSLDDDRLKELLPTIRVFARTTPEDKMRIGNLYRSLGEVVAMTGDGVNDAPTLKAMDIGISLGSGSDVAKSAADMILLDNNFKTITDTITEGYKIKSRIQKVFVYLMSSSLDEVFVIAGSLALGLAFPLSALQIIWINILTGTLPALAFAYETSFFVEKDRKHNKIFNLKTKAIALGIGTLSSALLLVLYYVLNRAIGDLAIVRSVFFISFAAYSLVIAYSFRNLDRPIWKYNPFSNMRLNGSIAVGLALLVATVTVPLLGKLFGVAMLPLEYAWIVFVWIAFNVVVVECAKFWMRAK